MTAKKKNIVEQSWEIYFKANKKLYKGDLDEQMLFQIYKEGFLLAFHISEKFHNQVSEDIRNSKLGENHDG